MSERDEQQALFDWAEWQGNITPELKMLFAIPNGQYRRGQRPEPGIISGVPDICLPVPRGGKHGFYGELKVGKNKTSERQDWWIEALRSQGYRVVVAYGFEAMRDAIMEYLEAPSPKCNGGHSALCAGCKVIVSGKGTEWKCKNG